MATIGRSDAATTLRFTDSLRNTQDNNEQANFATIKGSKPISSWHELMGDELSDVLRLQAQESQSWKHQDSLVLLSDKVSDFHSSINDIKKIAEDLYEVVSKRALDSDKYNPILRIQQIKEVLERLTSVLNSEHKDGSGYIFGGTRTDAKPITTLNSSNIISAENGILSDDLMSATYYTGDITPAISYNASDMKFKVEFDASNTTIRELVASAHYAMQADNLQVGSKTSDIGQYNELMNRSLRLSDSAIGGLINAESNFGLILNQIKTAQGYAKLNAEEASTSLQRRTRVDVFKLHNDLANTQQTLDLGTKIYAANTETTKKMLNAFQL